MKTSTKCSKCGGGKGQTKPCDCAVVKLAPLNEQTDLQLMKEGAKVIAEVKKAYFDELLLQGFSQHQALYLCAFKMELV